MLLGVNTSEFRGNITQVFHLSCHPTELELHRMSGPVVEDSADLLPRFIPDISQFAEISARAKVEPHSFVAACVPTGLQHCYLRSISCAKLAINDESVS